MGEYRGKLVQITEPGCKGRRHVPLRQIRIFGLAENPRFPAPDYQTEMETGLSHITHSSEHTISDSVQDTGVEEDLFCFVPRHVPCKGRECLKAEMSLQVREE